MKKTILIVIFAAFFCHISTSQDAAQLEAHGIDQLVTAVDELSPKKSILNFSDSIPPGGFILIPESSNDGVWAFDPETGNMVDDSFIVDDVNNFFSTPIQAIQNTGKDRIYVSDQIEDLVQEFDNDGNYIGIFAPAGGQNPSYADNIRGLCLKNGTDHILVADGNNDAIQEFDATGNYVGTFGPQGAFDPFDIIYWPANNQYLVADISGSGDTDKILILDNSGNISGTLASGLDFPEQIALAANGNILVATFTSPSGIYEFAPDGTQVGYYDVVTSCRGVYELPNGNLLVTSGGGVFEISKNNVLIDTKVNSSSYSFRFAEFVAPPITGTINVTFRVDMSQQTIPPEGVHIAGNFQNWNPGSTSMANSGNDIYTYTQLFNPGDSLKYKFVNGDEWGEDESVPGECALDGNRYLVVPDADTTLIPVCFSSCDTCGNPVEVIFQVDMSQQTISPDGIHIAGNFQGWNPGTTQMSTVDDSIFTYTKIFSEGDYIEYKFVNGNEWGEDESVPTECALNNNRFLYIPENDTLLSAVCYSSCEPCEIIIDTVVVTFRVDMSEQIVSPDGIHLAGSFQGWDPATTEMTLTGNNLYEKAITLNQGEDYEYVFINGNMWDGQETVPPECGIDNGSGGFNRFLTAPLMDSTLTDVCFGSCIPCDVGVTSINAAYNENITVYPNPFTEEITIGFYSNNKGSLQMILTDPFGRELRVVQNHNVTIGHNDITLLLSDYGPGIYFLQASLMYYDRSVNQVIKVVKKR